MMVHHLIARPVTGHRNQRHDPEISARSFFGRCLNLDDSVQHRGYRAKLPLRQAPAPLPPVPTGGGTIAFRLPRTVSKDAVGVKA